jgi:hypothetical protein
MLLEEVHQLLNPGYLSMETGYCRLPNGQAHASVLTRFPGCTGEMLEWWGAYGLNSTERYKLWDPKAHLYFEWDDKYSPGHYIGASHYGEELVGGEVLKFRVRFVEPGKFFDTARFSEAGIEFAVCSEVLHPDGAPNGHVIHLLRRTDYGSEVRSRLWAYQGGEEVAKGLMEHCIGEMGNLADILPDLYEKEH